jgi:hypothetical protein
MDIKQNSKYILNHPYTKEAIKKYNEGNTDMLEHLFFETQFHVFDMTALLCSRTVGIHKWNNIGAIKGIVRHVDPPTNLSISLKIPPKK